MSRTLPVALGLGAVALGLGAGLGLWLLAPAPVPRPAPRALTSAVPAAHPVADAGATPGAAARGDAPHAALPGAVEVDGEDDEGEDLVGGQATYAEILAAVQAGRWLDVETLLRRGGSEDPRVTDLLVKHLADERWRHFAANLFEFVKDPGAAAKVLALVRGDAPESTRIAAMVAAAHLGGAEITEEASRMLRESADGSRMAAAAALALGRIDSADSARVLVELLRDGTRAQSRAALVQALGEIRSPQALEALAAALHEEGADNAFRTALVQALGRTRDPAVAADLLRVARETDDPDLRREAWQSLAMVGGEEATRELASVFSGGDPGDQLAAAVALQGIRDKGAAGPIGKALAASTDPTVRAYLVGALGNIGSPESVPLLSQIATDATEPSGIRAAAIRALAGVGDAAGVAPILDAYEGAAAEDTAVRRAAIAAIGNLAAPSALPRLRKSLESTKSGSSEYFLLQGVIASLEKDAARREGSTGVPPQFVDRAPGPIPVPGGPAGEVNDRGDGR